MNFTVLKNHKLLFTVTLIYFLLGFIDVHFGLLGILCMFIPLFLLFKTKKKTYCQGYCPRANLFTTTKKKFSISNLPSPEIFTKGNFKWFMLGYFFFNLVLIIFSTFNAYKTGNGILSLKFYVLINGFELPQLLNLNAPVWLTHLSYRFYSMMISTTILGLLLGLMYKPRTWCTICPISTVSDVYIKSVK